MAIPGAAVGALCAGLVSGDLLRRVFACGIVVIGGQLFRSHERDWPRAADESQEPTGPPTLVDAKGIPYRYTLRHPRRAESSGPGAAPCWG